MKNQVPALKPIISSWMKGLLNNFNLQKNLIETYGSPLNIHCLRSFQDNISEYQAIFENYDFKSKIFYARKANKCSTLAATAHANGIGVDTASYNELKECLALNIPSTDLVLTAAIKNKKLLQLTIQNQVLIIIDNADEANLVLALAKKESKKAFVGFRISGFEYKNKKLKSRFGFDIDAISAFLKKFFCAEEAGKFMKFKGFHFHLTGYSTQQRGAALHQTLNLIENLKPHGLFAEFIDIGGGILINYLQSKKQWNAFQAELKKAILLKRSAITYANDGLGFRARGGKIEGKLATYPYYNEMSKNVSLKNILNFVYTNSKTVAARLSSSNIELRLEPGRSLLDQVGITMAKVAHRKKDANGDFLIGLEMNMTQMASSSADFLLDPVVNYAHPEENKNPVEVYFTGAYCLERDILLKRKIILPKLPKIGDIVTFVNTAGYMMHFFETEAHLFELSQNIFTENFTGKMEPSHFFRDKDLLKIT